VFKSTETEWEPNKSEKSIIKMIENINSGLSDEFSKEHARALYKLCYDKETDTIIEENIQAFFDYTNKYICLISDPPCYGFREETAEVFKIRKKDKVIDRVGSKVFDLWNSYDRQLKYKKIRFIIDKEDKDYNNKRIFNKYNRPKTKKYENSIVKHTPLFFDFLLRVISADDTRVYIFLIHYIAKLVQVGFTEILLCFQGRMGCGKSTLCDILKIIVGSEYYQKVDDVHRLTGKFNALSEHMILTSVEEVISNAGEYHSLQSKLKSLTTDRDITIEPKGIDPYTSLSNNNYILNTNECNPIFVNEENRRYLIQRVSNCERNNRVYFKNLRKQVLDNIEYLREYFNNFEYIEDLNSIRPVTQAEKDLIELNMSITTRFIKEEMRLRGEEADESRKFNDIYQQYKVYCMDNSKKPLSDKYFSNFLKNNGFITYQIQKNKHRTRYIKREETGEETEYETEEESEMEEVESEY
jgi:phage/plasmid-associated DNA primase